MHTRLVVLQLQVTAGRSNEGRLGGRRRVCGCPLHGAWLAESANGSPSFFPCMAVCMQCSSIGRVRDLAMAPAMQLASPVFQCLPACRLQVCCALVPCSSHQSNPVNEGEVSIDQDGGGGPEELPPKRSMGTSASFLGRAGPALCAGSCLCPAVRGPFVPASPSATGQRTRGRGRATRRLVPRAACLPACLCPCSSPTPCRPCRLQPALVQLASCQCQWPHLAER